MKSDRDLVAAAGWRTYTGMLQTMNDERLDVAEVRGLLKTIPKRLTSGGNRARYTMNGFVIAAGSYVAAVRDESLAAAQKMGLVTVDMWETACEVPDAVRALAKGLIAKKKTIRC